MKDPVLKEELKQLNERFPVGSWVLAPRSGKPDTPLSGGQSNPALNQFATCGVQTWKIIPQVEQQGERMNTVLESRSQIPASEGLFNLINDFWLLDKPLIDRDNPIIISRKPVPDHGTADQVSRYMQLMARVSELNAYEREEFHNLMEIVSID